MERFLEWCDASAKAFGVAYVVLLALIFFPVIIGVAMVALPIMIVIGIIRAIMGKAK